MGALTPPSVMAQTFLCSVWGQSHGVGSLQHVLNAAPGAPASLGVADTVLWGHPGCWTPRAPGKGLVRGRGGWGPPWDCSRLCPVHRLMHPAQGCLCPSEGAPRPPPGACSFLTAPPPSPCPHGALDCGGPPVPVLKLQGTKQSCDSLKINKRWRYFIQWVVNIWNSLPSRCCVVQI